MNMNYSNMTVPQLLMMLNPGAANTTYLQPNQEAMLRNQSISPYTPQGNVQMPNMQPLNIEGLLGSMPSMISGLLGSDISYDNNYPTTDMEIDNLFGYDSAHMGFPTGVKDPQYVDPYADAPGPTTEDLSPEQREFLKEMNRTNSMENYYNNLREYDSGYRGVNPVDSVPSNDMLNEALRQREGR